MKHFNSVLYRRLGHLLGGLTVLLLMALSCSKSTDPDTDPSLDAGPIGVLLSGNTSNPALTGATKHGPFAVPDLEVVGNFVTTRLEATLHPNATVGQVNDALTAAGAKISCMRPGLMFTELVVPPLPSVTAALALCSTLVSTGALLTAYPAYLPTRVDATSLFPDNPANGIASHLEQEKFPAAWNARELVSVTNTPVTVLVADHFRTFSPHAEIPAQSFLAGKGVPDLAMDSAGNAVGNHGFMVAGIIGARFDGVGTTGVYADPGSLLRLPCASVKGLGSFIALIAELDDRLPTSGHFILNTSFSYNGDFTQFSKRQRIEHALFWRLLVAGKQDRFMHTTAAGNEGVASNSLPNATYATPFALSARFDTPMEMLQGTAVSSKDTADLNLLYTAAVNTASSAAVKTRNLLVIGSSDLDGNLSSFSNLPSDVRMIGETVTLPCAVADAECAAGSGVALQALVDGTSFAAPQVAGLAAWLWSLSPALSVDETIAILKNCYNGKWVDAYMAVLSLDHSEATAVVRKWILDVADGNGQQGSNGAFDEKDIQMYIDSLLAYEAERVSAVPPYSRDHSIFDLNGDGFTGDTTGTPSTAPFDLDVNVPPAYATVSVTPCNDPTVFDTTYDEHAVTDRDILRYYAYSSLYQGVDSTRDRLFGVSCSPFWAGPDSSSYRTYISCFPLNIQEDDTNAVGFTSVNIDETRDSLTALCKDTVSSGYRFQLAMSGDASLSASVGPSNVSVNGGASLHSTATATAPPEPSPCRFGIAGFLSSVNMVRFAMGGDKFSVPMSLVVSGSVTPTNASGSSVALARCIVKLFVVDTTASARLAGATEPQAPAFLTFDSDVNSLPFQMNSFLTLLQEHNVYQMEIFAQAYSFVTTQVPPGTGEAKIDVSVSLFAGD